jgi:hypothetical protein
MQVDRRLQRKKVGLVVGVILVLLVLLTIFVYLDNRTNWLRPLNETIIKVNLEILVVLVSLTLICAGGVYSFTRLWKSKPKPIAFDIGLRLVATGYVVSILSAVADYTGLGAHHMMLYFGPLQTAGVFLGELVIAIGFSMMFLSYKPEM